MNRHRETPTKQVNPSGKKVWIARYTNAEGRRVSAGVRERKGDAQKLIDDAYKAMEAAAGRAVDGPETIREYLPIWLKRYPRSERTDETNRYRIQSALDAKVNGTKLGDWPLHDLRREHAKELIAHLLVDQKRAASGATGVIRALSVLAEDAITDRLAEHNAFKGVKIRANDSRVTKPPKKIRVWTFDQMHAFAAAGGVWEPLIRIYADCGLRLGEGLPLRRSDLNGAKLTVGRTAHEGTTQAGTKTTHGEAIDFRVVPVPPGMLAIIAALPPRIDTPLLFPTQTGKLWRQRNFYRDVWYPAQEATGMDIRPHEMRHSWVSHLIAAGVPWPELAKIAGHSLETLIAVYAHDVGIDEAHDAITAAIG